MKDVPFTELVQSINVIIENENSFSREEENSS